MDKVRTFAEIADEAKALRERHAESFARYQSMYREREALGRACREMENRIEELEAEAAAKFRAMSGAK